MFWGLTQGLKQAGNATRTGMPAEILVIPPEGSGRDQIKERYWEFLESKVACTTLTKLLLFQIRKNIRLAGTDLTRLPHILNKLCN
jgi:hypothetical protein